ncbi:Nif11-like leader peptide family RiPP precursor [Azospirillum cavernae]|nr:Nif11-like leader peptide family RiPP precursor [Azospirillum cavernae]
MSQSEIERLLAAVTSTPDLIASYHTAADAAELAQRLRADGYDISEADIIGRLADGADGAELSDEDLDGVAGGSRVRSMREIIRWSFN